MPAVALDEQTGLQVLPYIHYQTAPLRIPVKSGSKERKGSNIPLTPLAETNYS